MKVHVVHGILCRPGCSGLLNLVPYLRAAGLDCRVPDYGLITAVETNVANPLIRRTLLPYIEPGDLYIGHSNGCAIGYELLKLGAPLAGVTFINGALKRDISLPAPPTPSWLDVYYNEGDDATVAAVIGAKLGLTDPVWGEMGHAGYAGADARVTNIDAGKSSPGRVCLDGTQDLPRVLGHSAIFEPAKLGAGWARFITSRILAHLKA
jgi:hypothetical protein